MFGVCILEGCGFPTPNLGDPCYSVHCKGRNSRVKKGDLKFRGEAFACTYCPNPVMMPGQSCGRLDCVRARSMRSGSSSRARSSSGARGGEIRQEFSPSFDAYRRGSQSSSNSGRFIQTCGDYGMECRNVHCRNLATGTYPKYDKVYNHKFCPWCREHVICVGCWRNDREQGELCHKCNRKRNQKRASSLPSGQRYRR